MHEPGGVDTRGMLAVTGEPPRMPAWLTLAELQGPPGEVLNSTMKLSPAGRALAPAGSVELR